MLRAVAILPVLFFHYSNFAMGRAGVDLFFCISGFVMAGQMHRTPAQFAWDRFTRIYPPFLAAMALLFVIHPMPLDPLRLAKSLALYPVHREIYLYPAWSLGYEAMFYTACVLALVVRGRWIVAAFAILFLFHAPIVGSSFVLEFLAGFAIARKQWWALPVLLAAALYGGGRVVQYGPPAALLLFLCTSNERWFAGNRWRPVALIGDASYAIYLTHTIVGYALPGWLPLLATIYICLAVGLAFHFWIEKPLLRGVRRAGNPRMRAVLAARIAKTRPARAGTSPSA